MARLDDGWLDRADIRFIRHCMKTAILSREREQKNRGVGNEKPTSRGNQVWQRTPRCSAPIHLLYSAQSGGEGSICTVTLW